MAVNRILVAQHDSEENQWLKVDHNSRYIQNHSPEWQFLFSPNSELTTSQFTLKVWAKFDDDTLTKLKLAAYLYNNTTASIGAIDSCVFNVYRVTTPDWTEVFIDDFTGVAQLNNYYYANPNISALSPAVLDGSTTLMIECVVTRLGVTYRDRIYLNHLGVFDNILRLKQEVYFNEAVKLDE